MSPATLPAIGPPGDGRHPTVSIVSLNYNGRRYLERFLQSLQAIDYPQSCVRVVLVDNASTDGSAAFVRARFPGVALVEAGDNLGFAGGCNLGIRATRSDYVALVNNDTVVEPGWLRALVEVAEADAQVGMVGSKILFLTPFLELVLETGADRPREGKGAQAPALELHAAHVAGCDYDKLIFRAGHLTTRHEDGRPVHVLGSRARLAVPVTRTDAPATLILALRTAGAGDALVRVSAGGVRVGRLWVTSSCRTLALEVPREIATRAARDVINNVGTRIDSGGRFGDRGIFEVDDGQYDLAGEVPALCGASVLLRRAMLERIGGFDTRYFMYFEDVDLSWRARRAGWRLVYTPLSRLRHVHAGTSGEGSPLWVFFVRRNHLFWLIKHGTAWEALRALAAFGARVAHGEIRTIGHHLLGRPCAPPADRTAVNRQIARSLGRHLPGLLVSRYRPIGSGGRGRWTTVTATSGSG